MPGKWTLRPLRDTLAAQAPVLQIIASVTLGREFVDPGAHPTSEVLLSISVLWPCQPGLSGRVLCSRARQPPYPWYSWICHWPPSGAPLPGGPGWAPAWCLLRKSREVSSGSSLWAQCPAELCPWFYRTRPESRMHFVVVGGRIVGSVPGGGVLSFLSSTRKAAGG